MYDAIIVGARCGGAPLAMQLTRAGNKVLLLDRMAFGSDIMSTHFIKRTGISRLVKWGLLDELMRFDTPRIGRQMLHVDGIRIEGAAPAYDGIAAEISPRRFYLDKVLVDAAMAAGVEARDRFSVTSLIVEEGRVVGIRGKGADNLDVAARAKIVIGADGVRSMVANAVGAEMHIDAGSHTCARYAYFSGMRKNDDEVSLYINSEHRRFYITCPTNDGLEMVLLFWHKDQEDLLKGDTEAAWNESLALVPELEARVRAGKRESRFIGANYLPNFFRRAHGPGWALVGDAALHRDPITAQGISNAFTHADILAEELNRAFRGEISVDEAGANYDRRQFELLKPMFDYTVHMAMLQPPTAEMTGMLPILAQSRDAASAFFGAFMGSLPLASVFPPALIERFAADVARGQQAVRAAAAAAIA